MVLVGAALMEAVGECIMTLGCIQVGAILTHGIQAITVMDMEVGTTLGGAIADTVMVDMVAVITATTTTVVAGMVVAAMGILDVMLFRETVIPYQTTNVISFPT